MSHTEKMLNSFDERFWKLTKEDNASYAMNGREGKQIKHFLLSSHREYIVDQIKRLEGERKTVTKGNLHEVYEDDRAIGFNSALTQQIAVLEREIKEVEELIKK